MTGVSVPGITIIQLTIVAMAMAIARFILSGLKQTLMPVIKDCIFEEMI
jgi:hypothetical protein